MFSTPHDYRVKRIVEEANSLLLFESVTASIATAEYFDMSTALPEYLSKMFHRFMSTNRVNVVVYYPKWRFSKAVGYFTADKPNTIHVNAYKFYKLDVPQAVALLFHEAGHAMDFYDKEHIYNHGDNNPIGKRNTFQYSLNRYVYDFYGYIKPVNFKLPWWRKVIRYFKS